MNKIKYLLAMLLLVFTSCSDGNANENVSPPQNQTTETGKTLIVYFSWSGNTRTVANIIHELTGCDMIEIEVEEPYSDVYNEVTARARQELDNNIFPTLRTQVENMDKYDILIVGTPIWSSALHPRSGVSWQAMTYQERKYSRSVRMEAAELREV